MIETKLVPSVSLWEEDAPLLQAVTALGSRPECRRNDGNQMLHAILNEEGKTYCIIETKGLSPLLKTVQLLQRCGLTDLIRTENQPVDGFDAIWSPGSGDDHV